MQITVSNYLQMRYGTDRIECFDDDGVLMFLIIISLSYHNICLKTMLSASFLLLIPVCVNGVITP